MTEFANPLEERELEIRRRFAKEYIYDYDPILAAIRLGYSKAYAEQYGKQFLSEPRTQQLIQELSSELGAETEEEIHRRRVVAALYREANLTGAGSSHSARVAALAQIARITGILAPEKTEGVIKVEEAPDMSHLSVEQMEQVKQLLYAQPAKRD